MPAAELGSGGGLTDHRLVAVIVEVPDLERVARRHLLRAWSRGRPSLRGITSVTVDGDFELVVMTGHAFQVFTTDDEVRGCLHTVAALLSPDGRVVFETRNPSARGWERWTAEHRTQVRDEHGSEVTTWNEVELPVRGDLVSFTTTFASPEWDAPQTSRSTLRFLDAVALEEFLDDAALEIAEQHGDWDGSPLTDAGPEIITIARHRR